MGKILTSVILIILILGLISPNLTSAAPKVVEDYHRQDGNDMYAFPNKLYINTYAAPSTNSKIVGTIKRNGAIPIDSRMSNGWYSLRYHSNHSNEYVRPEDVTLVRENDIKNHAEPVYPFPDPGLVAPAPAATVPSITSKPTDDVLTNIETITNTLGFEKKVRVDGIYYYYFAPDGEIVRNGGQEALEFHYVPNSMPRYGEFRLLIGGWEKNEYTRGQIDKVPAAIQEILKFYFPTSYQKIYSMLYKGYETGVDMDDYINIMFVLDNREFRVEAYHEGAEVGIYIGKEGERYTNSFTLPDNIAIVKVNGKRLVTSHPAIIESGSTLVPLRGIFEALGATVAWDQASQTIKAKKGANEISLTIGKKNAIANEKSVALNIVPKVNQGTTLVPLRFISQALGANVEWDEENKIVLIKQ